MIDLYIPANHFYPELPGGSLQYFRYAPYLLERDIRMHVFTPLRPEHTKTSLEIHGIQINRIHVAPGLSALDEMMSLTHSVGSEIEQRGGDHCCIQPIGAVAKTMKSVCQLWRIRLRGIPVVRHFVQVPDHRNARLKNRIRLRIDCSPYSKMLMCSSEMGRSFQKLAGLGEDRIKVIPNGINQDVFRLPQPGEKEKLRSKLLLPPSGKIVLYVGSIIARKGVDLLIESWARVLQNHPDATLVIVGSNTVRPTFRGETVRNDAAQFIERIKVRITELGISNRVVLTGEVDNVEEYYRASDIFAFASHQEGLPSAILEAMASGLAPVLAPFNGFPMDGEEYGTSGRHFLKVSHDPTDISAKLCRLLYESELCERIGQEASQWIQATQGMDKAADFLAESYRSLFRRNM
jgi:glycosyltransferase involved in cell wall biosynthesis